MIYTQLLIIYGKWVLAQVLCRQYFFISFIYNQIKEIQIMQKIKCMLNYALKAIHVRHLLHMK